MRFARLTCAVLAGTAAPALGQTPSPTPAPPSGAAEEDVILVLGQGLPETPAAPAYATIEIERERLVSTGSGRIEDALASVAGFQQFRRSDSRSSNPSAQGVTLRALGGNATSRALVLLDGVPIADPFFGYIPLSAIAPERLAQVSVTRGGGQGAFGAGALAGTIQLESADATTLGLASGQALVNNRGETELSATLAPELGEGFAVVSGRWDRGRGFFTTPEEERVPASARARFDAWSTSARLVQRVADDVEIQLRGLAFEDQRTLRFEGAENSSEGQDVSFRLVTRGPWQVDALAYAQWRNFTNIVISSSQFTPTLDQKDTPSTGQGGKLEIRPPVGEDHVLRFGADFRRSEGDLFEDAYNAVSGIRTEQRFAGGVNTDFGLFLEDDWSIGERLVLTGGIRADRYRITDGYYRSNNAQTGAPIRNDSYAGSSDWEVTYRAGALYRASDTLRLRAAAYSGFRLPTLNELYRPFVVFPVVTSANADLLPERLDGYEAGIDWQPTPGLQLSLTAFDNEVEDAIANVTLAPNQRQRRNLDAIEARGIELAASAELDSVSFAGTLAYTDAQVRGTGNAASLDGNRPSQTPEIAASGTVSWRPSEGALLAATLRHVGEQFESDVETDVLPAATTLDLFGQYPLVGALSAVARVENLFDEEIVTRNDGGTRDIGVPQTFWIGLRYGF
jgi:outer membrane receptor protein involved in Fe transport